MSNSRLCIPMKEIITFFAFAGMLPSVNFPSISVTVPVLVPFIRTEAPTIGRLSSSEMTTPVTFDTCAIAMLM